MKNILQKLLSIKNEEEHKILRILGFKVKLRKKIVAAPIIWKPILNSVINLVTSTLNEEERKSVLKKHLAQIEIEIFSFCNRQCWFCPNSFIDRHSENNFMEEALYLKILSELKEIDYSNAITYSRYNEPLADKIFLTRLRQAREYLPNAILRTNSNGDYLTREYLDELADAGLNAIEIQGYLNESEVFNLELAKEKVEKISAKLKLDYDILFTNEFHYAVKFKFDSINVTCYIRDFTNLASTRGDSLDKIQSIKRTTACLIPFKNLYIDYNGSCMLCCNLRSDIKKHEPFIIGNAYKKTISEIFTDEKMVEYRRLLGTEGEKIYPCNTCSFMVEDNIINL